MSGNTKQGAMLPGQRVFVNHFVSSVKGKNKSSHAGKDKSSWYSGGCVFVDAASGYIHVEMQTHLNSHTTLSAKREAEKFFHDVGVYVMEYVNDLGSAFTSKAYEEELATFQQTVHFAGTAGHHHNPLSERAI